MLRGAQRKDCYCGKESLFAWTVGAGWPRQGDTQPGAGTFLPTFDTDASLD
jgi:hypothetical protein